jgi:hypothetical protein
MSRSFAPPSDFGARTPITVVRAGRSTSDVRYIQSLAKKATIAACCVRERIRSNLLIWAKLVRRYV